MPLAALFRVRGCCSPSPSLSFSPTLSSAPSNAIVTVSLAPRPVLFRTPSLSSPPLSFAAPPLPPPFEPLPFKPLSLFRHADILLSALSLSLSLLPSITWREKKREREKKRQSLKRNDGKSDCSAALSVLSRSGSRRRGKRGG